MKLIYFTSLDYPSNTANSKQVLAMAKCFREAMGDDFVFIINSNQGNADVSKLNPLEIKSRWKNLRTVRNFWWILFNFRTIMSGSERSQTVLYSKDANLFIIAALLKPLFGYRTCFEMHMMFSKIKNFFITKADRIVCITSILKSRINSVGAKKENVLVEPDAVDLGLFDIEISRSEARKKLQLPADKKILLYTGRFKTMGMDKGLTNILNSLKYLDVEVLFVAVGGLEANKKYYSEMAQEMGVSEKCVFVGYSPQETLALYQKAADVLLMPFPFNQHYAYYMSPLKMFEYMASRTPIIASDLPSIRDVLNEDTAFFCKPDDSEDLAKTVEEALNNQELSQNKADKAHEDVKNYTWDKRVGRILRFLEKVENP